MNIIYRLSTPDDHAALVRLWSEEGGWDHLEAETWADRLLRTPLGAAAIAVAQNEDTGELVGQFAFIPSMIATNGQLVPAVRPFAPIVARSIRSRILSLDPRKMPAGAMYRTAVRELSARGQRVAYMIADPHWLFLLKFNTGLVHHRFPLWSLPLPLGGALPLGHGFDAAPLAGWDERVERLWERASKLHRCLVVRNTSSLPWKVGRGDYEVLGVERGGELVGLVASRAKGDAQWLICDLLSVDLGSSLRATLAAACNLAHSRTLTPSEPPLRKIAILAPAALEPMLRELNFGCDNYKFPLVVHRIDDSLAQPDLDPSCWYVSAND
jgi:hypothetical protein